MKIVRPALAPALTKLGASMLDSDTETIQGASLEALHIDIANRNLAIVGSSIKQCDFTSSDLERLSLDNVVVQNCIMTAGKVSEASWHTTTVQNSRCSGVQLDKSTLKNVTFTGCKLDIANFRYAKLTNVVFDGCVIDELDFYGATMNDVKFVDCDTNGIELQNTHMHRVDFRESNFVRIKRATDLQGATISTQQLMFLSRQLAAQAGIVVGD